MPLVEYLQGDPSVCQFSGKMGGQIQNLLNENFFKTQKNCLSNFKLNLLSSFEYTSKRTDILLLLRKKNINHRLDVHNSEFLFYYSL